MSDDKGGPERINWNRLNHCSYLAEQAVRSLFVILLQSTIHIIRKAHATAAAPPSLSCRGLCNAEKRHYPKVAPATIATPLVRVAAVTSVRHAVILARNNLFISLLPRRTVKNARQYYVSDEEKKIPPRLNYASAEVRRL